MAPKGGNSAKKESGRAKKAENEANRRREAAEANVRTIFRDPHFSLLSIEAYAYISRNGKRQPSGKMAQSPINSRRTRKRSVRQRFCAKRRTRDCLKRKRRRPLKRKPLQRRARRKPPSPRAPVPSPLRVRVRVRQSPQTRPAPARTVENLKRSRASLPQALTMSLIWWTLLLRKWTRRVLAIRPLVPLRNTRRCVHSSSPSWLLHLIYSDAETSQGAPFSFSFVLRVVYVASRPHSTLTWIGNCPLSEQKYAALLRVLLALLLQSLSLQQPGLRLQQYKVLCMNLRNLRMQALISVCQ